MPTNRSKQITRTLMDFYSKPIAKISLELFISVFTVIIFALFAIRPVLLTMSDLIKEIDDKKQLNTQLTQKIAALSSAQAQYLTASAQLPLLDQAIPPTPQFDKAILIIEKIASDRGLLIESMSASEIPKEPSKDVAFAVKTRVSTPVTVILNGDYPTISQFVDDIRNSQRTMVIDSIVFAASPPGVSGKPILRATIQINVEYFGVAPAAPTAPGATLDVTTGVTKP